MDEEVFNMQIRKSLKHVGVTSPRGIEHTVRDALADGRLEGGETVKARVVLSIESPGISHAIDGDIDLV